MSDRTDKHPLDEVAEIVALGNKIAEDTASLCRTLDKDAADKREIAGNIRLINDIIDAGSNPTEMPIPYPEPSMGDGSEGNGFDWIGVEGVRS